MSAPKASRYAIHEQYQGVIAKSLPDINLSNLSPAFAQNDVKVNNLLLCKILAELKLSNDMAREILGKPVGLVPQVLPVGDVTVVSPEKMEELKKQAEAKTQEVKVPETPAKRVFPKQPQIPQMPKVGIIPKSVAGAIKHEDTTSAHIQAT